MGRTSNRSSLGRAIFRWASIQALLCALIGAGLAPLGIADDSPVVRTWTSADGKFSTRGELLDRDDTSIKIRNDAGREVTVPLSRLCKEDRAYLKGLPKPSDKKKKPPKKTPAKKSSTAAVDETAAADKPPLAPSTEISECQDYEEFKARISKALGEKKYDLLEATRRAVMNEGPTFTSYTVRPKLEVFYGALSAPPIGPLGVAIPYDEAILDWVKSNPKSKTPLLAAAQHEISGAWAARGNGAGSTVTAQGAQIFAERIDRARALLAKASDLEGDDPDFYRLLFIVARAQSWEWKSAVRFYTELMEKCPDYAPAHMQVAMMLMPRWGGEPGQMEQQTAETADKIGDAKGDEIYAQVVGDMLSYHRKKMFDETHFDYERAIRGFDSILARHPNSNLTLQQAGYLSALKNDVPRAGKYFTELAKTKTVTTARFWQSPQELQLTSQRSITALTKGPHGPLIDPAPQLVVTPLTPTDLNKPQVPKREPLSLLPPAEPLPAEGRWKPQTKPLAVRAAGVSAIRFLPHSRFLIAAASLSPNANGELSVWDCESGFRKLVDLRGGVFRINARQITTDSRGERVEIRGFEQGGSVQFWSFTVTPATGSELPTLQRVSQGVGRMQYPFFQFTPSGQFALQDAGSRGANLLIAEKAGVRDGAAAMLRCENSLAVAGAFSTDSKVAACAFENGKVLIAPIEKLLDQTYKTEPIAVSDNPLSDICFANDNKLVCCCEPSGLIHLVDIEQKSVVGTLQAPGELKQMEIHPRGRLLATAHGESDCVCVWDLVTRKELQRFTGHTGDVNTVSFASNGKVLASGSQDGTIRLWDVPKPQ